MFAKIFPIASSSKGRQCYPEMSVGKIKGEANLTGDTREAQSEEMLDIKYHDIKTEVKKEGNYGNLHLVAIFVTIFMKKDVGREARYIYILL